MDLLFEQIAAMVEIVDKVVGFCPPPEGTLIPRSILWSV